MTEKEKEIQKHMKLLHISREEAEQLWEDDNSNEVLPEVAEMERKAKTMKRRYEGDTTKREPGQRIKKLDPHKLEIIATIAKNLTRCVFEDGLDEPHNIQVINEQREISFYVGSEHYSITLTKHKT